MAGRPLYYETPELLAKGIDDYFEYIKGEKGYVQGEGDKPDKEYWVRLPEPATITGLIIFLGFSHREALIDYEKREGFSDIVKRGRLLIECEYEKRLAGQSPTGAIFALKNMGWRDKVETGFTDTDGKDRPVQIIQLPHNGRDNSTAE